MTTLAVREARARLSEILSRVEGGEEIVVTRRGQPVVRLLPATAAPRRLPSNKAFRDSVKVRGVPMSELVSRLRDEERY